MNVTPDIPISQAAANPKPKPMSTKRSLPSPKKPMTSRDAQCFMEACVDPNTDDDAIKEALLELNERIPKGEELAAFASVLLRLAKPAQLKQRPLLDTCGTGGDARKGVHTANLSTLCAMTLAALGINIAKHGNRAASSKCGSADLLEALGMDLGKGGSFPGLPTFHFLFAPHFHPTLARVGPIRKSLGVPTVFNMLGPLLNPASPEYQILGVAKMEWMTPMAKALSMSGVKSALVVHGLTKGGAGMDEASTDGPTLVIPVRSGRVGQLWELSPEKIGITPQNHYLNPTSRESCITLAKGLLEGSKHPLFNNQLAEEVSLQVALGLMIVRQESQAALSTLLQEARKKIYEGLLSAQDLDTLKLQTAKVTH